MEFKEFAKQFARMARECEHEDNPFNNEADSDYVEDWLVWAINHPDEAEDFVSTWVKENPELIYPMFMDVMEDMLSNHPELNDLTLNEVMRQRVPQDVAVRYGIAPLNDCGLSKYVSEWR